MTSAAIAVPQAALPAAAAHPTGAHVSAWDARPAFAAALDDLEAEGRRSAPAGKEGDRASDAAPDAALGRPAMDPRAALAGGALMSLTLALPVDRAAGAEAASLAVATAASGPARTMGAGVERGASAAAPAAAKAASAPRMTGERTYFAPTGLPTATAAGQGTARLDAASAGGADASAPASPGGEASGVLAAAAPIGAVAAAAEGAARAATRAMGSSSGASGGRASAAAARAARTAAAPAARAPARGAEGAAKAPAEVRAVRAAAAAKASDGEATRIEAGTAGLGAASAAATPVAGAETQAQALGPASALGLQQAALSLAADAGPGATEAAPAQGARATPAQAAAQAVREIDLDLGPSGVKDATMTVRLAGDGLGVVIRAASGETVASIEAARDAIAERLNAIGQPVASLIIQQTGGSDATGSQTAGEEGADERGAGDPRGDRRQPSRG